MDEIKKLRRMISKLKVQDNNEMKEGDVMVSRKPICASCNQVVKLKANGPDYYSWNEVNATTMSNVTSGLS